MKSISFNPDKYKKKKSKHTEEWKEIAEEMTKFFNTNCFPIFHRLERMYITDAFRICKEKDIHNIAYFWGCVKNNKQLISNYKKMKGGEQQ